MTIRLYMDEDAMRRPLVVALRSRGADVLTAGEAGMAGRPDEDQLDFAATHGRAVYSYNVGDFCRLHGEWLSGERLHAGIVLARQQQFSIGEQMRRLLRLMAVVPAEDMRNRLEFLSAWE